MKTNKDGTIKYTIKDRKNLKARAWGFFAKYIRDRDGNVCVTCGSSAADGYRMNAGHYIHKRENFNEKNVHCQCFFCNKCRKGNMRFYTLFMVKKYGIEYVEYLLSLEKTPIKLESAQYYLDIIETYKPK